MLVNLLILFFLLLFIYQIFLAFVPSVHETIIEGAENQYKNYDTDNPENALILAQQNAGNIEYIKGRIDEIMGLKGQVMDNCGNIVSLNDQMSSLIQQMSDLKQEMVGDEPADVSGTN